MDHSDKFLLNIETARSKWYQDLCRNSILQLTSFLTIHCRLSKHLKISLIETAQLLNFIRWNWKVSCRGCSGNSFVRGTVNFNIAVECYFSKLLTFDYSHVFEVCWWLFFDSCFLLIIWKDLKGLVSYELKTR